MTVVRLVLSAWLIYKVAQGHTWALVTLLILMTLAHEAVGLMIRRLTRAVGELVR